MPRLADNTDSEPCQKLVGVTEPNPNRWNAQGSPGGPRIKHPAPRTSGT